jgi:hypothetical protein
MRNRDPLFKRRKKLKGLCNSDIGFSVLYLKLYKDFLKLMITLTIEVNQSTCNYPRIFPLGGGMACLTTLSVDEDRRITFVD